MAACVAIENCGRHGRFILKMIRFDLTAGDIGGPSAKIEPFGPERASSADVVTLWESLKEVDFARDFDGYMQNGFDTLTLGANSRCCMGSIRCERTLAKDPEIRSARESLKHAAFQREIKRAIIQFCDEQGLTAATVFRR